MFAACRGDFLSDFLFGWRRLRLGVQPRQQLAQTLRGGLFAQRAAQQCGEAAFVEQAGGLRLLGQVVWEGDGELGHVRSLDLQLVVFGISA
jgi:hypothetical protein